MEYYVEYTLYTTDIPLLMRFPDDRFPERYDYRSNKWITDKTLNRIYIGEILVDVITEQEAKRIIENVKKNLK